MVDLRRMVVKNKHKMKNSNEPIKKVSSAKISKNKSKELCNFSRLLNICDNFLSENFVQLSNTEHLFDLKWSEIKKIVEISNSLTQNELCRSFIKLVQRDEYKEDVGEIIKYLDLSNVDVELLHELSKTKHVENISLRNICSSLVKRLNQLQNGFYCNKSPIYLPNFPF